MKKNKRKGPFLIAMLIFVGLTLFYVGCSLRTAVRSCAGEQVGEQAIFDSETSRTEMSSSVLVVKNGSLYWTAKVGEHKVNVGWWRGERLMVLVEELDHEMQCADELPGA